MTSSLLSLKNMWKKVAILCAVSTAFSVIRMVMLGSEDGMFLTDTLFTIGSVFLFFGIGGLVKNMGMFTSFKYGTKCLMNMFRGKRQEPSGKMAGDYLEYMKSRPKAKDVPWTMAIATVFLILSAICALPML